MANTTLTYLSEIINFIPAIYNKSASVFLQGYQNHSVNTMTIDVSVFRNFELVRYIIDAVNSNKYKQINVFMELAMSLNAIIF